MTATRDPLAGCAVGIDGWKAGWIAARLEERSVTWQTAPLERIDALCPDAWTVGVDIPIGLVDRGLRRCDASAQSELRGASSSVFTTPPRPVIEVHLEPGDTRERTQALSRELSGQGVTPLALALARRILAVDAFAATRPGMVEVHPEVSFRHMAPRTAFEPKSSARGVFQRLAAISTWLPEAASLVADAPPRVPIDDALDALAALWSAVRWRDGIGRTLPADSTSRPFIAV